DDHDVIHDNNSPDLTLSTSLNELDFATLNIDGQSTKVEAPPDIIVVEGDDDFIDDEDDISHDLADSDDEVLVNVDDDDKAATVVYSSVGYRKATRGDRGDDRDGGRKGVHKETRNLGLKKSMNEYGPLKIRFERNNASSQAQCCMMERSEIHEYPSLILTFYNTYTYDGVWAQDEAQIQYEMLRLRDLGANTPSGVPYTKEQILALVRKGKQRGHIPRINETLASRDKKIDEAKDEAKHKLAEDGSQGYSDSNKVKSTCSPLEPDPLDIVSLAASSSAISSSESGVASLSCTSSSKISSSKSRECSRLDVFCIQSCESK
ncbi:hypothetical protein Tco_0033998, partial [Tanacetum coccineum]